MLASCVAIVTLFMRHCTKNIISVDQIYLNTSMISIYTDTDQHEYWIKQICTDLHTDQYSIVRDYTDWCHDTAGTKVALLEILEQSDIEKKHIADICQQAKQVLLFIPELIDQSWLHQFDHQNVTVYVAGKINTVLLDYNHDCKHDA
jgi:hypothetical protein